MERYDEVKGLKVAKKVAKIIPKGAFFSVKKGFARNEQNPLMTWCYVAFC